MTGVRYARRPSPATGIYLLVALLASVLTAVLAEDFPAAADTSDPRIITTVAGGAPCCDPGEGGPPTGAWLTHPSAAVPDGAGNVYIAEAWGHRVRKVDPAGTIKTVAGTGEQGYSGDGGNATSADLSLPTDVAIGPGGVVYIADDLNNRVRRIDGSGVITTVAGTGQEGFGGDGAQATDAELSRPTGLALDAGGNLYIADSGNHRIRRVDPGGVITTVAGSGRVHSNAVVNYGGDGGPATSALLNYPSDVVPDGSGGFYIADTFNGVVRKVDSSGTITTVAGVPPGLRYGGDGGPAILASLHYPGGVAVDGSGNLYISDYGNHRIRRVDPAGVITTVAGSGPASEETGEGGFGGDGGPAEQAKLNHPGHVDVDSGGNLWIADVGNARVRRAGPDLLALRSAESADPVRVGDSFSYTVTVGAAAPATGVALTDTPPPGAIFRAAVPSQGSCSYGGGTVTCTLGDLGPSASAATVRIDVTAPNHTGELVNTATVTSADADPDPADNTVTERTTVAAPPGAGLAMTMADFPDPVGVGEPLTYNLAVGNGGPTTQTGVTVDDPLPAGVAFTSATPSQGACSLSSGTASCALGDLAPATTATIEVRVTPTQPAALVNTATVRSDQTTDGVTATAETTVRDPSCGQVISASVTLAGDIGPCPGDGLVVGADDITLDLGGHRLIGFPGPGDGHQAGIRLTARTGVTVTNGTVEGFDAGVVVDGGASNTVSALTVRDNLGPDNSSQYDFTLGDGILVMRSSGNRIVGNILSHNGPYDGIGILGLGSNLNTIDANTVERTVGTADGYGAGQGVILNAFLDVDDRGSLLEGNRITNNVLSDNASAGLSNFNNAGATIEGNTVERNGFTNRGGNGIAVQFGPGVPVPVSGSVVRDNQVHGNAMDGIHVSLNANTNQIVDNDASDNNAAPYVDGTRRGYDLYEEVAADLTGSGGDCLNLWSGNRWGSGGYNVACTTNEGSGPPPPAARGPGVANFSGGSMTNFSVFRPENGAWYIERNWWNIEFWGASGDLPAAGDYDGNRGADKAVFRPSTGAWYVQGGATTFWGTSGDVPVPGDYDADGADDIAVFRPSTGAWYVQDGPTTFWGTSGDVAVPGDYDGDGADDIAVFRPSTGAWYVQDGPATFWGTSGDVPVPGDYDGNGRTDIAVFRPSTGAWFVQDGPTFFWGTEGDIPVPGDYNGNGITDMAVFRPTNGAWYVPGGPTVVWGAAGDRPLPLPTAIHEAMSAP